MSIETHPVQVPSRASTAAKCPSAVTLLAYEVYCHIHSPQPALITGGCRGGFSVGELIAFLYARNFSKDQWAARSREAFTGMELGR